MGWTIQEVKTALTLKKEGLNYGQIGMYLKGRSRSAVAAQIGRARAQIVLDWEHVKKVARLP